MKRQLNRKESLGSLRRINFRPDVVIIKINAGINLWNEHQRTQVKHGQFYVNVTYGNQIKSTMRSEKNSIDMPCWNEEFRFQVQKAAKLIRIRVIEKNTFLTRSYGEISIHFNSIPGPRNEVQGDLALVTKTGKTLPGKLNVYIKLKDSNECKFVTIPGAIDPLKVVRKVPKFHIDRALEACGCLDQEEKLYLHGFKDAGAFAYITDDILLNELNIFNPNTREKILLASHRIRLDIERYQDSKKIVTPVLNPLTIDGKNFYQTLKKLQNSIDAKDKKDNELQGNNMEKIDTHHHPQNVLICEQAQFDYPHTIESFEKMMRTSWTPSLKKVFDTRAVLNPSSGLCYKSKILSTNNSSSNISITNHKTTERKNTASSLSLTDEKIIYRFENLFQQEKRLGLIQEFSQMKIEERQAIYALFCQHNHVEMVHLMTPFISPDHVKKECIIACKNGHFKLVQSLIQTCDRKTIQKGLLAATLNNHVEVVKYLFTYIPLYAQNTKALQIALLHEHRECIEFLVKQISSVETLERLKFFMKTKGIKKNLDLLFPPTIE